MSEHLLAQGSTRGPTSPSHTEGAAHRPQVPNDAERLRPGLSIAWYAPRRFLILGNEGGTYYATERALTVENVAAASSRACAADAARAIRTIVEVSD